MHNRVRTVPPPTLIKQPNALRFGALARDCANAYYSVRRGSVALHMPPQPQTFMGILTAL